MEEMLLLDKRTKNLIEDYVPKGDVLEGIVCFFSVFSDYTRVKILSALAISELCVTDMSRLLEINQTTVSHQLRFLKSAGIVKSRRLGKIVFYSLFNIASAAASCMPRKLPLSMLLFPFLLHFSPHAR